MTDASVNIEGGMGNVLRRGRRPDTELAERRRGEILDAAAALFARDSYALMDVQEVADRLGLAKGTIYRYFPSKEKLFLAAVDRGMLQLRDHVRAVSTDVPDPLDRIAAAVRGYLEFYRDHPEVVELLVIERARFRDRKTPTYLENREAVAVEWRRVYAGLIRDGRVRNIPPDRIIDMVGDLLYGTMFTNHFTGRHRSLAAQARELTEFIFAGILTPAEHARRGKSNGK
jgi:AcrR family transcriptional regulator